MKLTGIEIIKIVADEQCRKLMRELLPNNTPMKLSKRPGEHAYHLVSRCSLLKVARELGMKDWGEK